MFLLFHFIFIFIFVLFCFLIFILWPNVFCVNSLKIILLSLIDSMIQFLFGVWLLGFDDIGLGLKHGFHLWWLVGLKRTVGIGLDLIK